MKNPLKEGTVFIAIDKDTGKINCFGPFRAAKLIYNVVNKIKYLRYIECFSLKKFIGVYCIDLFQWDVYLNIKDIGRNNSFSLHSSKAGQLESPRQQ